MIFIKNVKGFTLIELLAVISIIAILFVLLTPQINSAITKARDTGVLVDYKNYENEIRSFIMENNSADFSKVNDFLKEIGRVNGVAKSNAYGNKYSVRFYGDDLYVIREDRSMFYVRKKDNVIETFTTGLLSDINASSEKTDGDFKYRVILDKEIMITGYTGGNKTNLVIPNEIEGKPVTFITNAPNDGTEGVFSNKGIVKLTLPNELYFIGPSTFRSNSIDEINIPTTLSKIGHYAFSNNLLTNLTVKDNLNYIAYGAFQNNKIETLSINNATMNVITTGAFRNNSIKNLSITSPIVEIQERAFNNNSLTTFTAPNTVKLIMNSAFGSNPITTYQILGDTVVETNAFPTTDEKK